MCDWVYTYHYLHVLLVSMLQVLLVIQVHHQVLVAQQVQVVQAVHPYQVNQAGLVHLGSP